MTDRDFILLAAALALAVVLVLARFVRKSLQEFGKAPERERRA